MRRPGPSHSTRRGPHRRSLRTHASASYAAWVEGFWLRTKARGCTGHLHQIRCTHPWRMGRTGGHEILPKCVQRKRAGTPPPTLHPKGGGCLKSAVCPTLYRCNHSSTRSRRRPRTSSRRRGAPGDDRREKVAHVSGEGYTVQEVETRPRTKGGTSRAGDLCPLYPRPSQVPRSSRSKSRSKASRASLARKVTFSAWARKS